MSTSQTELLETAVEQARGWVDPERVEVAERALAGVSDREAIYDQHVVVALAGGTGSGKSSLFNGLIGRDVSETGVARPTTSRALGFVSGDAGAGNELLSWIGVPDHHTEVVDGIPEHLVLLDLPDHDSAAVEHRLEVDRLIDKVDVLIWVVDPEKYADAELHHGYLRPLADHAATFIVVLNQIDLISDEARREIQGDLENLLKEAGLSRATVMATSAATGSGVAELRSEVVRRVNDGSAAREKTGADLDSAARGLIEGAGGDLPKISDSDEMIEKMSVAVGAGEVQELAAANYGDDARQHLGFFLTTWAKAVWRGLRSRLPFGGKPTADAKHAIEVVVPPVRGAAATQVSSLALAPVTDLEEHLPGPWAARARTEAEGRAEALPGQLDEKLRRLEFSYRRPRWWWLFTIIQTLLGVLAVVGFLWLAASVLLLFLRFPEPPVPTVGGVLDFLGIPRWQFDEVPVPSLMLVGSLILGPILGWIGTGLSKAGQRRQRSRARKKVRKTVAEVVEPEVIVPLNAHRERREAILASAGAVRTASG